MLDNVGNGRHKTGCFMLCMHTAQMYINIYYSFLLTGSHIFIICASKNLGGRCLLVPKCHHRPSLLTCLLISDHVVET